jgi:hypothetical protein
MPVDFLDVLLPLVDKEQLRRDRERFAIGIEGRGRDLVFVLLDRKIPEGDLVVRARGGEYRRIGRVPLDGCDGCSMPREMGDGLGLAAPSVVLSTIRHQPRNARVRKRA